MATMPKTQNSRVIEEQYYRYSLKEIDGDYVLSGCMPIYGGMDVVYKFTEKDKEDYHGLGKEFLDPLDPDCLTFLLVAQQPEHRGVDAFGAAVGATTGSGQPGAAREAFPAKALSKPISAGRTWRGLSSQERTFQGRISKKRTFKERISQEPTLRGLSS